MPIGKQTNNNLSIVDLYLHLPFSIFHNQHTTCLPNAVDQNGIQFNLGVCLISASRQLSKSYASIHLVVTCIILE